MSGPNSVDPGGWESLSPWEKAAQWRQTAPDIADEVIALAKMYAEKNLKIQQEQVLRDFQLTTQQEQHRQRMELLTWVLELLLTIGSLIAITGSLVLSWKYASNGHVFPGLGVIGIGGAASVGIYTTGRAALRRSRRRYGSIAIAPERMISQSDDQE
jgi:hypothetical protein